MDRREFLKSVAVGVLGAQFASPSDLLGTSRENGPKLVAVTGSDPELSVDSAIDALGGMSRFISPGDMVVVKPNMSFDRTPDQAANTNPAVVSRVVKLVIEAGAELVKVFDNTVNDQSRCYDRSGVAQAATAAGASVEFTENRMFVRTNLGGEALGDWWIHSGVLEADKLINVPVAKQHSLTGVTSSLKNLMGLLGGPRGLLHQKIDVNLADLAAFFKPTLNILDGTRVLIANGPYGGNLKDVKVLNKVAVSSDPVALDSYGATWFGMKGDELGFVRVAHERGLGEMNLDLLDVIEKEL